MQIDIREVRDREEPLRVEADFGEADLRLKSDIVRLMNPVHAAFKVVVTGDCVRLVGRLRAQLQITCCRCLKERAVEIDKPLDLDYQRDPVVESENEEFPLTYADLTVGFYRGDKLELNHVVSEQILLEVPMKPLCNEDCKGLCDQCGADLNKGECGCQRTRTDPRLAVLADFKRRLGE